MKKTPYISIIAAAALWGLIGVFVRDLSSRGFTSIELTSLRAFVSAPVLTILLLIKNRSLLKIRPKDCWCFIGTGLCSFVFFNVCYFISISYTSLAVSSILLYTAPVFVMLLSLVLFREKMTLQKTISLALAFVGCVLVAGIGQAAAAQVTAAGIIAGVLSGFGYALYSIFGRYALDKKYDSQTITAYTFVFAAIGCSFLVDFGGLWEKIGMNLPLILEILAFGLLSSTIPFLLYTWGLTYVESSKASITATVEPMVATLVGIFVFHEEMTAASGIGILCVLAALILLNINPNSGKRSR